MSHQAMGWVIALHPLPFGLPLLAVLIGGPVVVFVACVLLVAGLIGVLQLVRLDRLWYPRSSGGPDRDGTWYLWQRPELRAQAIVSTALLAALVAAAVVIFVSRAVL